MDITRRRSTLQAEIERCIAQASAFIGIDHEEDDIHGPDGDDDVLEEEEDQFEPIGRENDPPPDPNPFEEPVAWNEGPMPEKAILPIPSTLGIPECILRGIESLVDCERRLRIGQANDALHNIRVTIGEKSFHFRADVRPAGSQSTSTRAWDKVRAADAILRRSARIYTKCRAAMHALDMEEEVLDKYQEITREQLQSRTVRIDPSAIGERNTLLAWFWNLDARGDIAEDAWMRECKSSPCEAARSLTEAQFTACTG